jgi:hypothetical protein
MTPSPPGTLEMSFTIASIALSIFATLAVIGMGIYVLVQEHRIQKEKCNACQGGAESRTVCELQNTDQSPHTIQSHPE